jgi:hypothetical protein
LRKLGKIGLSREVPLLLFLSNLPTWLGVLLVVILPTILAMTGPIVLRRFITLEHLASNNEIAGFKFATVGVIYSVLVAFAVIVVWEKFNEAELAVVQEASAAATLYRLAATQPKAADARAAIGNYLKATIEDEWPAMAKEQRSQVASRALSSLYTAVFALGSDGTVQPAIASDMFRQVDTITQARRVRIHLAAGVVPDVLWLVLSSGAVLTVAFTFFFATRNLPAQVMMTGILSFLVFMALFVIISIDHPFTGPACVGSDPIEMVLADFGS